MSVCFLGVDGGGGIGSHEEVIALGEFIFEDDILGLIDNGSQLEREPRRRGDQIFRMFGLILFQHQIDPHP